MTQVKAQLKQALMKIKLVRTFVASPAHAAIRTMADRTVDEICALPYFRSRYYRLRPIMLGHHQYTYRGVIARKSPFDLALYQVLVQEVRPDLVIEVGTNHGGGALYLADLLDHLGDGVVHTIDIQDHGVPALVAEHPRIVRFLTGWSEYPLDAASGFDRVIVIDDGSHEFADVLGALRRLSVLVTAGSYFVVEDGMLAQMGWARKYDGGPLRAIREFLLENTSFEVDRRFCDFYGHNATFSPDGFLKRNDRNWTMS